jgi:hypothetical protein
MCGESAADNQTMEVYSDDSGLSCNEYLLKSIL